MSFSDLELVKLADDLYDRGVPREQVREAVLHAPQEAKDAWFETHGVSYFLGQIDQRRRNSRLNPRKRWRKPVSYTEDGLQKPLVETLAERDREPDPIPPVTHTGETAPSKITTQFNEARAVRWVKTTQWEGRYLWDALTDIDWALTKIDKGRRRAESSFKTTMGNLDLIEEAVIEIKGGSTPQEAAEILYGGWQSSEQ